MDPILKIIGDYIHVFFGSALGFFLYKEKIEHMKIWEKLTYCALSIGIGIYLGDAINSIFGIDPAGSRAHAVSVITAVFGLAILGMFRDKIKHGFEEISTAAIEWVKGKFK